LTQKTESTHPLDDMHDAEPTPPHQTPAQEDPVLDAMGRAMAALRQFSGHTNELLEAFDRAAARRLAGASYRELASSDEAMLVDFTSGPLKDLLDALSEFRRRQIRALYDDGMSMAELGRALGVTRQRVAVLLGNRESRQEG
jgi:DNA-directed RNA polymerase specialized sigma24 family protein